ncbi:MULTISPECIES: Yip1 family protein [Halobacterium]|uniref:Yip1 family protein n=1 Tax=Halobacterium TaxID=2239 RepID=UPI00073E17C5|nr:MULTISPECIES: Yip1 family protein [Halobacterium]MCG1004505.1 YIP1 family protein [Halobacterium noricense]
MLRDALHGLRTLLFHPGSFFETHPPERSLGGAAVVVIVVAFLTTIAFVAVGEYMASQIDATVTVTTMEPWPQSQCASFAEMNVSTPEPCTIDEPQTKQVSVGAKLRDAIYRRVPVLFFATLLGWVLVAVALHAVGAFTGSRGSFTATLSVTGWAMPAQLVQSAFGIVGIVVLFSGVDLASDPELLADQLRRLTNTTGSAIGVLGALVGTAWQAYIWTHGLREGHDTSLGSAAAASALVAVLLFVVSLA